MKIHISEQTFKLLSAKEESGYRCTYRGEISVKGKGKMKTYWLTGKENLPFDLPPMQ